MEESGQPNQNEKQLLYRMPVFSSIADENGAKLLRGRVVKKKVLSIYAVSVRIILSKTFEKSIASAA